MHTPHTHTTHTHTHYTHHTHPHTYTTHTHTPPHTHTHTLHTHTLHHTPTHIHVHYTHHTHTPHTHTHHTHTIHTHTHSWMARILVGSILWHCILPNWRQEYRHRASTSYPNSPWNTSSSHLSQEWESTLLLKWVKHIIYNPYLMLSIIYYIFRYWVNRLQMH